MAKLEKIKLGSIDANPFRNIDNYPIDKAKLELLRSNMERLGFWEGYIIVRPVKREDPLKYQRYQLAFGHHRLEAAKALWGDDHLITVNLQKLSDEDMAVMLAHENNDRFSSRFYLSVIEPIEAIVKRYAEGRIELEKPDSKTNVSALRSSGSQTRAYTSVTVAKYLGWTHTIKGRIEPADRVKIALSALELIEKGVISREELMTLDQGEVATLVRATKARMKAEVADIDSTLSVKEKALKKAKKEGDTNQIKVLETEIGDLEEQQDKKALKAGKAAAREVKEALSPPSESDLFDTAAPEPKVPTKAVKSATQTLYDLIAKWEGTCLDTDPKWIRCDTASAKAKQSAYDVLMKLSQRAANRAKELK